MKISRSKVWLGLRVCVSVCVFFVILSLFIKQIGSVQFATWHKEDQGRLKLSPLFSSTWLNFIVTWLVFFCNKHFKVDPKCYVLGNSRLL